MRGTRLVGETAVEDVGIIPAHAGNTPEKQAPQGMSRDHPRACGEHPAVLAGHSGFPGSSPRMRGTLIQRLSDAPERGIIPAHAGNT